jgi:hypothetical protein
MAKTHPFASPSQALTRHRDPPSRTDGAPCDAPSPAGPKTIPAPITFSHPAPSTPLTINLLHPSYWHHLQPPPTPVHTRTPHHLAIS